MSVRLSIMRPAANVFLDAALAYALRGLRVIPLHIVRKDRTCSCGRADCATPGKHPLVPDWTDRATTDAGRIAIWFGNTYKGANVGIATGRESGIIVLDVDPRHGGDDSLDYLMYRYGRLDTLTAISGGGGTHYYFAHPGAPIPDRTAIMDGLDLKGDGGMVVAPPSVHESGGMYEFDGMEGFETPIAPAPDWLVNFVRADRGDSSTERQNTSTFRAFGKLIPEGERNDALASIAGYLRRLGAPKETILAALMAINESQCQPPLPDREVQTIAKSVARYASVVNDLSQMPADFSDLSVAIAAMPPSVAEMCAALRCNVTGFAQVWNRHKKMATEGWFPFALAIAGYCTRAGLSNADTASILAQHQRDFGHDYDALTVAEAIRLLAKARVKRPAVNGTGGRRGKDGGK